MCDLFGKQPRQQQTDFFHFLMKSKQLRGSDCCCITSSARLSRNYNAINTAVDAAKGQLADRPTKQRTATNKNKQEALDASRDRRVEYPATQMLNQVRQHSSKDIKVALKRKVKISQKLTECEGFLQQAANIVCMFNIRR